MTSPLSERVLVLATIQYLRSSDFNGLSLSVIKEALECGIAELRDALVSLIRGGRAAVHWEEVDINPHINRLGFASPEAQIKHVESLTEAKYHTCLYPAAQHLKTEVEADRYPGRPYELELALGEAQLSFRVFDLHVLEAYRNDPRYKYEASDIAGSISVRDAYFEKGNMPESDQVLLESFGFAYDDDLNRAVAVFTRYLSRLSPEHQQIWKAREVPRAKFKLHPDYFRTAIVGEFPERVSIFGAFCKELWVINRMAEAMGRHPLFLEDFGEYSETRPKKFGFLLRPTLEEYNAFVHLLDKLLSDNISRKFFASDTPLEEETKRKDGRIEVRQKGTIRLLDEWMRSNFRATDWKPWEEAIASLREVRQARQNPAHAINEDRFDYELIKEQRVLIQKAYGALRIIRSTFERHPGVLAARIEVPEWLREGKIWTV